MGSRYQRDVSDVLIIRREDEDTDITERRPREKTGICKSKAEAREETECGDTTFILILSFCCLSHPVCSILLWQLNKPVHESKAYASPSSLCLCFPQTFRLLWICQ